MTSEIFKKIFPTTLREKPKTPAQLHCACSLPFLFQRHFGSVCMQATFSRVASQAQGRLQDKDAQHNFFQALLAFTLAFPAICDKQQLFLGRNVASHSKWLLKSKFSCEAKEFEIQHRSPNKKTTYHQLVGYSGRNGGEKSHLECQSLLHCFKNAEIYLTKILLGTCSNTLIDLYRLQSVQIDFREPSADWWFAARVGSSRAPRAGQSSNSEQFVGVLGPLPFSPPLPAGSHGQRI